MAANFSEAQRNEMAAIIAQAVTIANQTTPKGQACPEAAPVEVKETHNIYHNVFSFTNRLRVKATSMDAAVLRQNVESCLRGAADDWYTNQLTYMSRVGLRNDPDGVKEWCDALISGLSRKILRTMLLVLFSIGKNAGIAAIPHSTTPPPSHPSFTSSFQQTPWSFNTGGFEDTSEYRKQVDDPLREELLPSLRFDISDYFDAVFGQVSQSEELGQTISVESHGTAVAGQMQPSPLLRKRSSSFTQLELQSSAKRSRSSFQFRDPEKPLHNRVHRRIVTRDAGKHVYAASSLRGIINGFLGAIHGHESLLDAGILHRDILIDGFLIDFDLPIRNNGDRASGGRYAYWGLRGEHHDYMYDLESFFWVFFWVCIHYHGFDKEGKAKRRIVPEYEDWNYLSTQRLADLKSALILEGAL